MAGEALILDLINRNFGSVEAQEQERFAAFHDALANLKQRAEAGDSQILAPGYLEGVLKPFGKEAAKLAPMYQGMAVFTQQQPEWQAQQAYNQLVKAATAPVQTPSGAPATGVTQATFQVGPEPGPMNQIDQRVMQSGGGPIYNASEVQRRLEQLITPLFAATAGKKLVADTLNTQAVAQARQAQAGGRQGFGADFNRIAFQLFGEGPYTPEQAGVVNARLAGMPVAQALDIARGKYGVGQEPAEGAPPAEGGGPMTRAEAAAFATAKGGGQGRAGTSERAISDVSSMASIGQQMRELGTVARRISDPTEGMAARLVRKGKQAVSGVQGDADVKLYNAIRKRLTRPLARLGGENGVLTQGDVADFESSLPDPDLPLQTQIALMTSAYSNLYTTAQVNAQRRGLPVESLGLPHPSEVPSWYGAARLPDGSLVFEGGQ